MIATLYDLGWDPQGPLKWGHPNGDCYEIDPTMPGVVNQIHEATTTTVTAQLWEKASKHENGKGLELLPDLGRDGSE